GREPAADLVHAERHDRVAVLVRRVEEGPQRIEARRLACVVAPSQLLVKCPPCERFAEWRNNLTIAQKAERSNPGPEASFPAMAQSMLVSYWLEVVQQRRVPMHRKNFSAARIAVMLSITVVLALPAWAVEKNAAVPAVPSEAPPASAAAGIVK